MASIASWALSVPSPELLKDGEEQMGGGEGGVPALAA
jgi:hypothetical protein